MICKQDVNRIVVIETMMAGCASDLPWMKILAAQRSVKCLDAGTPYRNSKNSNPYPLYQKLLILVDVLPRRSIQGLFREKQTELQISAKIDHRLISRYLVKSISW